MVDTRSCFYAWASVHNWHVHFGSDCMTDVVFLRPTRLHACSSRLVTLCSVVLWGRRNRDPTTGQCVCTLRGHTDAVCSLSAAEGNRLVSASWDKTARVWLLDVSGEESGTWSH